LAGLPPPFVSPACKDGAHVMLYAGERQKAPIVTHGPFVAEAAQIWCACRRLMSKSHATGH